MAEGEKEGIEQEAHPAGQAIISISSYHHKNTHLHKGLFYY